MTCANPDIDLDPTEPATGLFLNDQGSLPLETRKVLVNLLRGPLLDGQKAPKHWALLLREEALLRRHLNDLFLELVIDVHQKVAFTRQVDDDTLEVPSLLRSHTLQFLDSALLLFLRQKLLEAESDGVRAVVAVSDMEDALAPYRGSRNTDQATFGKRMHAAIERIKVMHLLKKVGDERYEVSPVLKLLFTAETIQSLNQAYQSLLPDAAYGDVALELTEPDSADPDLD